MATGQPFGFTLLERGEFDYDTEPACRGVVVARHLFKDDAFPPTSTRAFLSATQRAFYVDGKDLSQTASYRDACAETGLDFVRFSRAFVSGEAREATARDFARARDWGIRSFPTILLEHEGRMLPLGAGYATAQQLIERLESLLAIA